MNISKLIKDLQKIEKEDGDIEVCITVQNVLNQIKDVKTMGMLHWVPGRGRVTVAKIRILGEVPNDIGESYGS